MAINGIGQTNHPRTFGSPRARAVEALAQLAQASPAPSSPQELPAPDQIDETSFPKTPDVPFPLYDARGPLPLPQRTDIDGINDDAEAADLQETHPDEVLPPDLLAIDPLAIEGLALGELALGELALEAPTLEASDLEALVDTIVLLEAGVLIEEEDAVEVEPVEVEPNRNAMALRLMQARFQSALDAAQPPSEDELGDLFDMLA